jgi:hypothetical protein
MMRLSGWSNSEAPGTFPLNKRNVSLNHWTIGYMLKTHQTGISIPSCRFLCQPFLDVQICANSIYRYIVCTLW